jgi:hypothetical protein
MDDPSGAAERLTSAGACALFMGLTLALYWPALDLGFVSDDWYFLRSAARHSLPELFRLRFDPADPQSYHYVPVGEALFWVEYRAFGLAARSWHAVNLGLHALNAFLAYRLWIRVGLDRSLALAAAGMFAVLFFHYESVLFVSGLYYLLAATWLLGALLCFSAFLRRGGPAPYVGYLGCAAGSLLTIEAGMVAIPLAGLLELMRGPGSGDPWRRRLVRAVRHQAPALVLFALYVGARSLAPRTSMNPFSPLKAVGTCVYSLFGLASFNLPPLYELFFDHKRAALAAVALLLALASWRGGALTRFGLAAFVVGYAPHFFLSGFETRYFYMPGLFAGLFLASLASARAASPVGRAAAAWALVVVSAVAGATYRAERLAEWRAAADVTARTLAAACPPLSQAAPPVEHLLVVDAPDSFGRLWGTSFPAYVFRNGLSEALVFCLRRPEDALRLDFVETGAARGYNPKGSRRATEAEVDRLAQETAVLRYAASDPREVRLHVR